MKVAVLGVGALGSLFGARLAPHAEVTLVGSWPEHRRAISENGLLLHEADGSDHRVRLAVEEEAARAAPADLVLVLVKAPRTPRAARAAKRLLDSARPGLVLTLQNGLGNFEVLAAEVGEENVALGVTVEAARVLRPGEVLSTGRGPTHLVAEGATAERVEAAAALFRQAGFEIHLVEDAVVLQWSKLAVNAAINPLTAILSVENGFLATDPEARDQLKAAAREVAAVARAQGVEIGDPVERALEVCRATAANRSSMLQDVDRGVPTEIRAICGQVVEHGRRLGVPTPVNARFLERVESLTRNPSPPAPLPGGEGLSDSSPSPSGRGAASTPGYGRPGGSAE